MSSHNRITGVHTVKIPNLTYFNNNEIAITERLLADLKDKALKFTLWIKDSDREGGTVEQKLYVANGITGTLNKYFSKNVELSGHHGFFNIKECK